MRKRNHPDVTEIRFEALRLDVAQDAREISGLARLLAAPGRNDDHVEAALFQKGERLHHKPVILVNPKMVRQKKELRWQVILP